MAERLDHSARFEEARTTLTPLHNALQQAFGDPNDPQALHMQEEWFDTIIDRAIEHQVDPAPIASLKAYQEVVKYGWFGKVDDPLPDALGYEGLYITNTDTERSWGTVVLVREELGPTMFEFLTERLMDYGLRDLVTVRQHNFAKHALDVQTQLEQVTRQTAAGKWLESMLAAEQKQRKRLEGIELLHRQAAAEATAYEPLRRTYTELHVPSRRRYRVVDGERVRKTETVRLPNAVITHALLACWPDTSRELQRQLYVLEDGEPLTKRRERSNEQLKRLSSVLLPHLTTGRTTHLAVVRGDLVNYDAAGKILDRETVGEVGMRLNRRLFGQSAALGIEEFSFGVLSELVGVVFGTADQTGINLADVATHATTETAQSFTRPVQFGWGALRSAGDFTDALTMLKSPAGAHPEPYIAVDGGSEQTEAIFVSASDTETSKQDSKRSSKGGGVSVRTLRGSIAKTPSTDIGMDKLYMQLAADISPFVGLPRDASIEAMAETLQKRGRHDALGWCLGTIGRISMELKNGDAISLEYLTDLKRSLAYVEGLEMQAKRITRVPSRYDPFEYAQQKSLVAALRRAVEAALKIVDDTNRQTRLRLGVVTLELSR